MKRFRVSMMNEGKVNVYMIVKAQDELSAENKVRTVNNGNWIADVQEIIL